MQMSLIMWIVVIAYLVISVAAGTLMAKKDEARSLNGYLNSGNSLPPLLLAFSLSATALSGLLFMGGATQMYAIGWKQFALQYCIGGATSMVLAVWLLGKPMHYIAQKRDSVTIVDLFVDIYNDKRLSYIAVPTIIIGSTVFAAVQWQCLGNLFTMFGVDYKIGVVMGVVVVALYTNFGGNSSQAIVGTIQTFIAMAACLFICWRSANVVGGFTAMNAQLGAIDPGLLTLTSASWPVTMVITRILGAGCGSFGQPYLVIKYFQIKDAKMYPKVMVLGLVSYFFIILVVTAGLPILILTNNGTIPPLANMDLLIPTFITELVNPMPGIGAVMGGIIVAAALCTIMSTASSLMLSAAGSIVNDVSIKWRKKQYTDEQAVKNSKIAIWFITLISALIALFPTGGIFMVGYAAASLYGVVFAPSLIGGLRWRRATKHGAFWSMLISLILDLTLYILNATGIKRFTLPFDMNGMCFTISIIIFVVVSLATKPQEKLMLPPSRAELIAQKTKTA